MHEQENVIIGTQGLEARAHGFGQTEIVLADAAAFSDGLGVERQMATVRDDLSQGPGRSIFSGLGFEYEKRSTESVVVLPSANHINAVLEGAGIDDRRVVDHDGERASIPVDEYLGIIADGGIPATNKPSFRMHDLVDHGKNFMLLPSRAWGMAREMAAGAVSSGSEEDMGAVGAYLDSLTVSEPSVNSLAHLYGKSMNKVFAAALARIDMREVKRSKEAIMATTTTGTVRQGKGAGTRPTANNLPSVW